MLTTRMTNSLGTHFSHYVDLLFRCCLSLSLSLTNSRMLDVQQQPFVLYLMLLPAPATTKRQQKLLHLPRFRWCSPLMDLPRQLLRTTSRRLKSSFVCCHEHLFDLFVGEETNEQSKFHLLRSTSERQIVSLSGEQTVLRAQQAKRGNGEETTSHACQ